jgi:hypothetical protein
MREREKRVSVKSGERMPSSLLDNPEHWRKRAEEARSVAELMPDPTHKLMMLRVADDYERLARYAERWVKDREKFKAGY